MKEFQLNKVKFRNVMIESYQTMGVNAKKLLIAITHKVQKNRVNLEKPLTFNAKEIKDIMQINTYGKELDKATDELMHHIYMKPDIHSSDFLKFNIFDKVDYKNGTLYVTFTNTIKEYFTNFGKRFPFTEYELIDVSPLKNIHSIRIFELLKQYKNMPKQTRTFSLPELKKCLGIDENKYKRYQNLKVKILDRVQSEINNSTSSLTIEKYETVTHGRTIYGVKFIFNFKDEKTFKKIDNALKKAYEEEKSLKLNELYTALTNIHYEKYDLLYGGFSSNYAENGSPREDLMKSMLAGFFLDYPSFEEWRKKKKK
ncbi:MAG TPA: replication initiation protein [Victivallales bacterium]|nr:replication initiation protein [Victivallales bacterium]